jgi:hypothetical protein
MQKITLTLSAFDIQNIGADVIKLHVLTQDDTDQKELYKRVESLTAFRQFVRDKLVRLDKIDALDSGKLPKNLAACFYKAESERNGLKHQANQLKKRVAQEGAYYFNLYVEEVLFKVYDACVGDDFYTHPHGYEAYQIACKEIAERYPEYYSTVIAVISVALGASQSHKKD